MIPIEHSQRVTAWLPIRSTALDRNEKNTDVVENGISAFVQSLINVLPSLVPEVSNVNISASPPPPSHLQHLCRNSSLVQSKLFYIYSISATVSFVDTWNEIKPGDDTSYLRAISATYLANAISLSLHLSELAYPGTIMSSEGIVVDEEGVLAEIKKKHFLQCVQPYDADFLTWPRIEFIDLIDVTRWATSLGFPKSSFAITRLQRTLAAFTHVIGLGWARDGEILFRSMQGLEAFYCEGIGDLRRQLSHKSQLWLGRSGEKQNIVGKLYDHRSKFIHGAAKIQYWHDLTDPWQEDRKSMEEFSDAVDFSTRLLLSTLQKCIIDSTSDINWGYTYDASPSVTSTIP